MAGMSEQIVLRTTLCGKSYMWVSVGGRLELRADYVQRGLFSNGERHLMGRWQRVWDSIEGNDGKK